MDTLIEINNGIVCNGKLHVSSPKVRSLLSKYNDPYVVDHDFALHSPDNIPYIDETVVFLSLIEEDNYATFLTMSVPTIFKFLAKNIHYDRIYSSINKFANEFYTSVNISDKIITTKTFRAKKIIVFQACTDVCWPNENDHLEYSFDKLRHMFVNETNVHNKRIFIARNNAQSRDKFIVNEDKLLSVINPDYIFTGGDTIHDQAQLFHNANIIIGSFGAGLTNTMFCKPDTFILEFRHKNDTHQEFYERVYKNTLGLKHCTCYVDTILPTSDIQEDMRCNLQIDIDGVANILNNLPHFTNYVDLCTTNELCTKHTTTYYQI